jgi:hypothetical protein
MLLEDSEIEDRLEAPHLFGNSSSFPASKIALMEIKASYLGISL